MAITTTFMTADEYLQLPDNGQPTELVNGRVIIMNPPGFRHGQICNRIGRILGNFVEDEGIGTVVSNDSGIIVQRDPDTVRGADVAYYSYHTVPPGQMPDGYPPGPPDIVFEVLSPNDQAGDIAKIVSEYLNVGVAIVCVVDARKERISVHSTESDVQELQETDDLKFPIVLPSFSVAVSKIFS